MKTSVKSLKKNKIVIAIILFLVVFIIGFLSFVFICNSPVDSNDNRMVEITIEEGSAPSQIADKLYENGLIKNTLAFRVIGKITGLEDDLLAGNYAFSPSMSTYEIINSIATGETTDVAFTVIEGYSAETIASKLEKNGFVPADSFMNEVQNGKFDYPFLSFAPEGKYRLEGFLYPDTYRIPSGATAHEIVDMMLKEFNDNVYNVFKNRTPDAKYSFYDVLKVASIVEKEAGTDKERPLVASVVYNRLDKGMRLQMCSSVSYIEDNGEVNLTEDDINIDSPYNTYKHDGLPPTPIGNPGLKSIEAAFNPDKTNFLYFVLSDALDGTSKFSSDIEQFEKDKEDYYKAYNQQHGNE